MKQQTQDKDPSTALKCEKCGQEIDSKKAKWLELSNTDGNYYETLPKGHKSQGAFSFGTDCATLQLNQTISAISAPSTNIGEAKELELICWANDGFPPIDLNKQAHRVIELIEEIKLLTSDKKILLEALVKIKNWELPVTNQFWDKEETRPMSYGAAYGSNGERDYIKNIADQAINKVK